MLLAPDIIKFIAIIMVIITHVAGISSDMKNYMLWPFTIAQAVPLFLLLSVFLYCRSINGQEEVIFNWFNKKI